MSLLLTLKLFHFTPYSSFSMLTLNKLMPAGICSNHFHIYRSSHPEVFLRKGVLHLASLLENIRSVSLTLLKSHLCMGILLLSIIHEIRTTFDENPTVDMRVVFLDISKAFDKFWPNLTKLKSYYVEGKLFLLLKKLSLQ